MTSREKRTIKAFENCIEKGTYSVDYAITLIEDDKRYGWLSTEAKDSFYEWLDEYEARIEAERLEAEQETVEDVTTEEVVEEQTEESTEETEEETLTE